jgi:integrase
MKNIAERDTTDARATGRLGWRWIKAVLLVFLAFALVALVFMIYHAERILQARIIETLSARFRWAKTKGSEGDVALPERLAAELLHWRTLSAWAGDRDFIFPNSKGGFLDYENFEARVLASIRTKLRLGKLNFQILRCSYATLAVGEGKGTTRDVQTMLRHTRPDTTLENYVKDVPESVYAMSDAMYESIAGPSNEKANLATVPVAAGVQ